LNILHIYIIRIVDRIANDEDWLASVLVATAKSDKFTNQLVEIMKNSTHRQKCTIGIHRSDYMLHDVEADNRKFLQVELNTIASSFGALSSKIGMLR